MDQRPPGHVRGVAPHQRARRQRLAHRGARLVGTTTWGDFFKGELGEVALYSNERTDFNLALLMHQMALYAGVALGTPLTAEGYTQPQYLKPGAEIKLDRKPIARINCYGARHDANVFGQNENWRPDPMNQGKVEHWLRTEIRDILNACDDFEIMFNRPGCTYIDDIVPTYIWGTGTDPQTGDPTVPVVTDEQWAALETIFDEFGLNDHNNRGVVKPDLNAPWARRAWFYTGGGLPLKQSGSGIGDLETDGHMYNRVVGPVTGCSYRTILDNWTDKNPRYRCLHCDATINFYGLFTRLCNDPDIYEGFLLVGEAIPQDDEARKGAVWHASLEFPRAPWWNVDSAGKFDIGEGYNTRWASDWTTRPIYFGIESSEYPYLGLPRPVPEKNAGDGANMTIGDIYQFILKGATPVAISPQVRRKVGVAWNLAMKRVPMNAWDRTGRSCPVQR